MALFPDVISQAASCEARPALRRRPHSSRRASCFTWPFLLYPGCSSLSGSRQSYVVKTRDSPSQPPSPPRLVLFLGREASAPEHKDQGWERSWGCQPVYLPSKLLRNRSLPNRGWGLNWPEWAFLQRTGRWEQRGPLPLSPNLSMTRLALDSGSCSRSWSSGYSVSSVPCSRPLGAGPSSPLASSSAFPMGKGPPSSLTMTTTPPGKIHQLHHHHADGEAVRKNKLADSHKCLFQIPTGMFNSPGRDFAVG